MAKRMDTRTPRRRPLHKRYHTRDRQSVDRRQRRRRERRRFHQIGVRGTVGVRPVPRVPPLQLVNSSPAEQSYAVPTY